MSKKKKKVQNEEIYTPPAFQPIDPDEPSDQMKAYVEKRKREVGDLEVCELCGGIVYRCFEDGSGVCGDCRTKYPPEGEVI